MAKMIKLPSGISIDMEQGEIRTPLGRGPIPISHNTRSYITYRRSIWNRFDDFIGNMGIGLQILQKRLQAYCPSYY